MWRMHPTGFGMIYSAGNGKSQGLLRPESVFTHSLASAMPCPHKLYNSRALNIGQLRMPGVQ